MSLPNDLKFLYVQWLQDLKDKLDPRQEHLANAYSKAKNNLEETMEIFYYPSDLKKVKGIGATIIKRLEKKLATHCKELGVAVPQVYRSNSTPNTLSISRSTTALRCSSAMSSSDNSLKRSSTLGTEDGVNDNEPKKKKRKYIPKKNSGAFAILLALLENKAFDRGISKERIIQYGQKYSSSSMTPNFSTRELHSAWSSIKSLRKHDLVLEEGRPRKYSLTEKGKVMAETLKEAEEIVFEDEEGNNLNNMTHVRQFTQSDTEVSANLSALENSNRQLVARNRHDEDNEITNISANDLSLNINNLSTGTPHNKDQSNKGQDSSLSGNRRINTFPSDASRILPENLYSIRKRFNGISYELWPQNSYEVYPIVDHREVRSTSDRNFFVNMLAKRNVKAESKQLSLGDIVWVAKNHKTGNRCILNTIIERKRLDDLAFSIKDNRFMEQKNRLEKSLCKNKFYLIEETVSSNIPQMTEALKTALWIIMIYSRFSVIRTHNSDETVDELVALHNVILKAYTKKDLIVIYPHQVSKQNDFSWMLDSFRNEFEKNKNIECCHNFEVFQDIMGKNESLTIGELTINILLLIRGVSLEKAITIQKKYPTLNHILTAYRSCTSTEQANLLMYNDFKDVPGPKKITKLLSAKIAETFSG